MTHRVQRLLALRLHQSEQPWLLGLLPRLHLPEYRFDDLFAPGIMRLRFRLAQPVGHDLPGAGAFGH